MKLSTTAFLAISLAGTVTGCKGKVDLENMKPVTAKTAGDLSIVLENATGDFKQGRNDFILQFRDKGGHPVEVGAVQLGSSMSMPGMAPMSGAAEVTPSGGTGTYRVRSNFGMSGAWHFTVGWNGPRGQGTVAFNNNVR